MPSETSINPQSSNKEWFCLKAQTKREHIAAAMLARHDFAEVFCPRISHVKKTRTGKKRFIEAMFPGYFFAKFNYWEHHRQVTYSQGVSRIVELGDRRVIPEQVILDLIDNLPEGIIEAPDLSIIPGAEIEVITGSLKGLNGKVLAQLPAKNRIQILLEFLGREIKVELNPDEILLARDS